jgi:hypothetical protein
VEPAVEHAASAYPGDVHLAVPKGGDQRRHQSVRHVAPAGEPQVADAPPQRGNRSQPLLPDQAQPRGSERDHTRRHQGDCKTSREVVEGGGVHDGSVRVGE